MNQKFSQLKHWKQQVPTEGSDNLKRNNLTPEIKTATKELKETKKTPSSLTSKRTKSLNTKITPETYQTLRKIAYQKGYKLVEVIEEGIRLVSEKEKEK